MEEFIGAAMVCLGAYLFWEPSYGGDPSQRKGAPPSRSPGSSAIGQVVSMSIRPGFIPRRGLRLYRAFAIVGALLGLAASEIIILVPEATSRMSPGNITLICVAIGSFIGYILPRVAENYIVVLGPPLTVVMGYEYLKYERGIDPQELVERIPQIPEISDSVLSGVILVLTTFVTMTFRMHLRQVVPIFLSGILSGGMIGNGASIVQTKALPGSPEDIEVQFSVLLALCSIALQSYVKFYSKERGIKKKKAMDRERRLVKRTGDTVMIRCPECLENSPHKVVTRKESARGVELIVNCRGRNQFDEVCNFHHTVVEVSK